MRAQTLLLDPSYLESWTRLIRAKRDYDHSSFHAREQEKEADKRTMKGFAQKQTAEGGYLKGIVIGDVGVLPIYEMIQYRPDIWSYYGYACSTLQIRADLNRMLNDDAISRIVLDIDSPGGDYVGTPELCKDIYNARSVKEIISVANPLAASAGIWIGVSASKFYALGSAEVGSIGALTVHTDLSQYFTMNGIVNTILRSPENKADFNSLEPLKEETKEYYQQQINAVATEFQTAVAKARGVSRKVVEEKFGTGRMMRAADALAAGLIDGVVPSLDAVAGVRRGRSGKRLELNAKLEEARRKGLLQKRKK